MTSIRVQGFHLVSLCYRMFCPLSVYSHADLCDMFNRLQRPLCITHLGSCINQCLMSSSPSSVASPTPEPVHSVGARLHGSWASGGSDPPEECMVSTLERQHMASWSGRSSNMATLGRTRHRAAAGAGTDHPHNIHPPPNSTEHSYGERCTYSGSP